MSDNKVTTEGNNVAEAIAKAAEALGIPAEQVDHKLDLSHFRNDAGRSIPVDTVKIIAWAADPADKAGALAAKAWMEALIEKMGFEGKVVARKVQDHTATIAVDSESARFLVGRGGSTLASIQAMLNAAMEDEFGDWTFKIDVQGGRREERGDRGAEAAATWRRLITKDTLLAGGFAARSRTCLRLRRAVAFRSLRGQQSRFQRRTRPKAA